MATLQLILTSMTGRRRRPESTSVVRPILYAAAERQALFNRIAPVYDNASWMRSDFIVLLNGLWFLTLIFCIFWVILQLNDLLSLGRHKVWKRMAVSWSGYFWCSYNPLKLLKLIKYLCTISYTIVMWSQNFAKIGDWICATEQKKEILCWMCVVEVGIWLFCCLRKLESVARFAFLIFFLLSLYHHSAVKLI